MTTEVDLAVRRPGRGRHPDELSISTRRALADAIERVADGRLDTSAAAAGTTSGNALRERPNRVSP